MQSLILCLLLAATMTVAAAETAWRLTILHTNDLHGKLRPFTYTGNPAYAGEAKGGLARLATAIERERAAARHAVAVVDCGDAFVRLPLLPFPGDRQVDAMHRMGYDLFCVGNEELRLTLGIDTQARLLRLMRRSAFPWITANLTVGETGVPVEGMHPFVVRAYDHVRVGFLGLTAPRAGTYPQARGWTISDPLAAAKRWVPVARQECDILIAVTHLGVTLDTELAAQVAGIDAIIGGDSHDFLTEPRWVKNPQGVAVPIVQAGEGGVVLGRCELTFTRADDEWRLLGAVETLLPITANTPPHPTIHAIFPEEQ